MRFQCSLQKLNSTRELNCNRKSRSQQHLYHLLLTKAMAISSKQKHQLEIISVKPKQQLQQTTLKRSFYSTFLRYQIRFFINLRNHIPTEERREMNLISQKIIRQNYIDTEGRDSLIRENLYFYRRTDNISYFSLLLVIFSY